MHLPSVFKDGTRCINHVRIVRNVFASLWSHNCSTTLVEGSLCRPVVLFTVVCNAISQLGRPIDNNTCVLPFNKCLFK